tara:strand:+ start:2214 stop:4007 length:1794 start_codon:yes stop_codon:yes gene_type:complete
MNFQLISPESGNGYDYQVRFREPIVIKPNSRIKLNHATLTTDTSVNFEEPQTLTFSNYEGFPSTINPFSAGVIATIAAGTYTFPELQTAINEAINNALVLQQAADLSLDLYDPVILDEAVGEYEKDNDIVFGIKYNSFPDEFGGDFVLSATEKLDATDTVGTRTVSYAKSSATAATPVYDSYGLADTHFLHWKVAEDRVNPSNENRIYLATIDNLSDYVPATKGRIFAGFYGEEYARGLLPANTAGRTSGATFLTVPTEGSTAPQDAVPACFFGMAIDNGNLKFYFAEDDAGNSITDWNSQNRPIGAMEQVASISLDVIYNDLDFRGGFYFVPYIPSSEWGTNTPNVYVRVYSQLGAAYADDDGDKIIYDSMKTQHYFPYEFFKSSEDATVIDYTDLNTSFSQIPFNMILSSDTQSSGWRRCNFYEVEKDFSTSETANIIERYKIEFSDELATVLQTGNSGTLRPDYTLPQPLYQSSFARTFMFITSGNYLINSRSYSVLLNGLPIKNYKNKDKASDGGFAKTVLANLPAPFSTGTLIDNSNTLGNRITIYEPHQEIISNLDNNELSINSFDVKIVELGDETPATELTKSSINFTIM